MTVIAINERLKTVAGRTGVSMPSLLDSLGRSTGVLRGARDEHGATATRDEHGATAARGGASRGGSEDVIKGAVAKRRTSPDGGSEDVSTRGVTKRPMSLEGGDAYVIACGVAAGFKSPEGGNEGVRLRQLSPGKGCGCTAPRPAGKAPPRNLGEMPVQTGTKSSLSLSCTGTGVVGEHSIAGGGVAGDAKSSATAGCSVVGAGARRMLP